MKGSKKAAPAVLERGAAKVIPCGKQDFESGDSSAEKLAEIPHDDKYRVHFKFNVRGNKARSIALARIIKKIQDGTYSQKITSFRAVNDPDERRRIKSQLPAFCPAGLRQSGSHGIFTAYSGIVVLDVDGIPPMLAEELREQAREHEEVLAAFVSPSGEGVKVFWLHDGSVTDHRIAWEIASQRMVDAGAPLGSIDRNNDPGRDCFVSWDTEAFYKEPSKSLQVSPIDTQILRYSDSTEEGGVRDVLQKIQRRHDPSREVDQSKAKQELAANLPLRTIYKLFVTGKGPHHQRINPKQGTRNTTTVAMVTFLYRAVAVEVLVTVCEYFYRLNQTEFIDSFEHHQKDIETILRGVVKTWRAGLNPRETAVFDSLSPLEQVAFRICRDLGHMSKVFPMGQFHLAQRLSLSPNKEDGRKILRLFEELEFIAVENRGCVWTKGKKAPATTWRWNHSLFGTEPPWNPSLP